MSQFFFLPGGQFVQKDTVKDGTKGFTEINKKKNYITHFLVMWMTLSWKEIKLPILHEPVNIVL